MKIKHIYDPIFRVNYYYFLTKSEGEFIKGINKQFNKNFCIPTEETKSGGFMVFVKKNTDICCFWAKSQSELAHEIIHCIAYTLIEKGIKLTDDTDEIYAYYMEYLLRECNKK